MEELKLFKKKKLRNYCFKNFHRFLVSLFDIFEYQNLLNIQKEIRIIETNYKGLFFFSRYDYFLRYQIVGYMERISLSKPSFILFKKGINKLKYKYKAKKKVKLLQKNFNKQKKT
jgi:hypothetical protein